MTQQIDEWAQWIRGASRDEIETRSIRGRACQGLDEHTARVRLLDLFELHVDKRDKSLVPSFLSHGCWEAWITRAVARAVKPGAVIVNVGANMGYYARLAALLAGPEGLVVSVECHPRLRELLKKNTRERGPWAPVIIDGRAAWDASGQELTLSVPGTLFGSGSLIDHGPPPDGEIVTKIACTTVTIDDIMTEKIPEGFARYWFRGSDRPVDMFFADAEGAELRIWRGMQRTWARSPNAIAVLECAPTTPEGVALLEALRSEGLRVRKIDYSGEIAELESGETNLLNLWVTK
jgi:FkbM family methyltransferase